MDYQNASNQELENLVAQKDGDAICELGERFLYGKNGSPKNLTRAYQLFHKGEKRGLPRAYVGLGEMYRQGLLMAKNDQLARQYYQKANVPYPDNVIEQPMPVEERKPPEFEKKSVETPRVDQNLQVNVITDRDFAVRLDQAEKMREQENYYNTEQICREVLRDIANVKNGLISYQGNVDVNDFEIQANWIMAYTSYNQQHYQDMENFLSQENVISLYPWGQYLLTVSHKIMNQPDIVIEQDLQGLIMVCQNRNATQVECGDINVMIADLIMEGYGKANGMDREMAKKYYMQAINCGNEYAKEQYQAYGF